MEFNNLIEVQLGKNFTIKNRHTLCSIMSKHMFKTLLIEHDSIIFVSEKKDLEINYDNINIISNSIKDNSKIPLDIKKITISKIVGTTEFTSMLK